MRAWFSISAAIAWLLLVGGCATAPRGAAGADAQMATCHVCRYNNDLACVEFRKKESTPTVQHGDEIYCFCSKTCAATFAKAPAKYVPPSRK